MYEVVLALTILLGALAAVSQSISVGSRAAVQARLRTEAVLRCESKLAELLAGVEPLQPVTEAPFEDGAENWSWSLDIAPGPHPDLLDLEVTVLYAGTNRAADVTFSLRRFVRDPQMFLDAEMMDATGFEE